MLGDALLEDALLESRVAWSSVAQSSFAKRIPEGIPLLSFCVLSAFGLKSFESCLS